MAVAKAWETLAAEGYKTNGWQLMVWHDGSKFYRNFLIETNTGTIYFIKPGEHSREYRIRLEGDRVICTYFRGL
jgi:hypothetical protein